MRRFLSFVAYLLAATSHWWWEFVRTFIIYDPLTHLLKQQTAGMSVDTLVQLGSSIVFAALGTVLIWPIRPSFLRWPAFEMFLERDSGSNRFGIHSFRGITYIQISVRTTKRLTHCRVWYRRADFSPDGIVPFAMEHNERHAMPWSKGGLVMDIGPSDGTVRINVAIYDSNAIQFDAEVQTPSNLFPNLQRAGIHRLEVSVVGLHGNNEVSETQYLFINWRGIGRNFATVDLKPKRV